METVKFRQHKLYMGMKYTNVLGEELVLFVYMKWKCIFIVTNVILRPKFLGLHMKMLIS